MKIEELIKDLDPVTIIEFKNYVIENLGELCKIKNSNSKKNVYNPIFNNKKLNNLLTASFSFNTLMCIIINNNIMFFFL